MKMRIEAARFQVPVPRRFSVPKVNNYVGNVQKAAEMPMVSGSEAED